MKSLLLSLGLTTTLLSTTNFGSSIKSSTNIATDINHSLLNSDKYTKELVATMDLEISSNNKEQIKQIILNSLFILNNQVYINTHLLINLQNFKIKTLLNNSNFEKIIQKMYKNKMIVLNEERNFVFADSVVHFKNKNVWKEWHWYWFLYWKLHLNHEISASMTYILDTASSVTDVAYAISDIFPMVGTALGIFSAFCFANSIIFDSYDHGKGIWIGWFLAVPDMGWGSNK